MKIIQDRSGFTLIELLFAIAILGIIMIGLHQVMGTALSAHDTIKNKQDLLAQARYAMERMMMFVQETDYIFQPDAATNQEILQVSERLLDTYDNSNQAYVNDGDGYPDADNDSDGLINEMSGSLPPSKMSFSLDRTDENNWKLQELMPDYSTADLNDTIPSRVICENITSFNCRRLAPNLVEIQITLNNGEDGVTLKTRVMARFIDRSS